MKGRLNSVVSVERTASPFASAHRQVLLLFAMSMALGLWAFWPTITGLLRDWRNDQDYSVGQLVPLVAVYLLWRQRAELARLPVKPCWWGIGVIVVALLGWLFGLLFMFESAERYAMLLALVGVGLLLSGWRIMRHLVWVLLFLLLMVPLPGRVHGMISEPLQDVATWGAVFMLEVFGVTVLRQGHYMVLNNETPLFVAEACSGLRMLAAFVVVTATFTFMANPPKWQKATLMMSSIPIAVACNLVRLCLTAVLYMVASTELAEVFFHDLAGWLMMPLAILALIGELWILGKLVVPEEAAGKAAKE